MIPKGPDSKTYNWPHGNRSSDSGLGDKSASMGLIRPIELQKELVGVRADMLRVHIKRFTPWNDIPRSATKEVRRDPCHCHCQPLLLPYLTLPMPLTATAHATTFAIATTS